MALDLWFREDVMRILASTYDAMHSSTTIVTDEPEEIVEGYRQGFADALRVVAVAFGVGAPRSMVESSPRTILREPQEGGHLPLRASQEPQASADGR